MKEEWKFWKKYEDVSRLLVFSGRQTFSDISGSVSFRIGKIYDTRDSPPMSVCLPVYLYV